MSVTYVGVSPRRLEPIDDPRDSWTLGRKGANATKRFQRRLVSCRLSAVGMATTPELISQRNTEHLCVAYPYLGTSHPDAPPRPAHCLILLERGAQERRQAYATSIVGHMTADQANNAVVRLHGEHQASVSASRTRCTAEWCAKLSSRTRRPTCFQRHHSQFLAFSP